MSPSRGTAKCTAAASKGEADAARKLYRNVVEASRRLDNVSRGGGEVFSQEAVFFRNRLKEYVERLMLFNPVEYGRKGEEMLWRKVFYKPIHTLKQNKKLLQSSKTSGCDLLSHIQSAAGYYHHLIFRLQAEFALDLPTDFEFHLAKNIPISRGRSEKRPPGVKEWACAACHRATIYLGDLARYQKECFGNETAALAQRYYYQAGLMYPNNGMPYNQLGTLVGMEYYGLHAAYYYIRSLGCASKFEGASGNLKRIFEKNRKRFSEISKPSTAHLPSSDHNRRRTLKRFCVKFLYLMDNLYSSMSSLDSQTLHSLCQDVLQEFNSAVCPPSVCLPVLCGIDESRAPLHTGQEASQRWKSVDKNLYLDDEIIFKVAILVVMLVHKLRSQSSSTVAAAVALCLALFSHILSHAISRIREVTRRPQLLEDDLEGLPTKKMTATETSCSLQSDGPVLGGGGPVLGGDGHVLGGDGPVLGGDDPVLGGDGPVLGGDDPVLGGGKGVTDGPRPLGSVEEETNTNGRSEMVTCRIQERESHTRRRRRRGRRGLRQQEEDLSEDEEKIPTVLLSRDIHPTMTWDDEEEMKYLAGHHSDSSSVHSNSASASVSSSDLDSGGSDSDNGAHLMESQELLTTKPLTTPSTPLPAHSLSASWAHPPHVEVEKSCGRGGDFTGLTLSSGGDRTSWLGDQYLGSSAKELSGFTLSGNTHTLHTLLSEPLASGFLGKDGELQELSSLLLADQQEVVEEHGWYGTTHGDTILGNKDMPVSQGFDRHLQVQHVREISEKLATFNVETDTNSSTTGAVEDGTGCISGCSQSEEDDVHSEEGSYRSPGHSLQERIGSEEERRATFLMCSQFHGLMPTIKVMFDWLTSHPNIVSTCSQSSPKLWSRIATFLNELPKEEILQTLERHQLRREGGGSRVPCYSTPPDALIAATTAKASSDEWEEEGCSYAKTRQHGTMMHEEEGRRQQRTGVKEDIGLREVRAFKEAHKWLQLYDIQSSTQPKDNVPLLEAIIRVHSFRQFGFNMTALAPQVFSYNGETARFCYTHLGVTPVSVTGRSSSPTDYQTSTAPISTSPTAAQRSPSPTAPAAAQGSQSMQDRSPSVSLSGKAQRPENVTPNDGICFSDAGKVSSNRKAVLMSEMAHLRLKMEVGQLEKSATSEPSSSSAVLASTPYLPPGGGGLPIYLVPDSGALCEGLKVIKELARSEKHVIILFPTVINSLDRLKMAGSQSRDVTNRRTQSREASRWLETQLVKGSRFVRSHLSRTTEEVSGSMKSGPVAKSDLPLCKNEEGEREMLELLNCSISLAQDVLIGKADRGLGMDGSLNVDYIPPTKDQTRNIAAILTTTPSGSSTSVTAADGFYTTPLLELVMIAKENGVAVLDVASLEEPESASKYQHVGLPGSSESVQN